MYKSADKRRAYKRAYYKAHQAELAQYQRDWRTRKRDWAVALLGGVCVRCGATQDLHFDHIDPTTKHQSIGKMLDVPEAEFRNELAKCQLLCGPCHRAKTRENGDQTKHPAQHGSARMYSAYRCRCDLCRAWKRDYDRARRARLAAQAAHPVPLAPAPIES